MKMLYLFFHRLARCFRQNKGFFLLFLLGGIINALVFAHLYGTLPNVVNRTSTARYYRSYAALPSEYTTFDEAGDTFSEMLESPLFEAVIPENNYAVEEHVHIIVCAAFTGEPTLVKATGSMTFTEPGQIIVPYDCAASVGETITLQDKRFTIIGKHNDHDYYISSSDYLACFDGFTSIHVYSTQRYPSLNNPVSEYLSAHFPKYAVPNIYYLYDDSLTTSGLQSMCLAFLICTVSFLFLMRYMIDSLMGENIISMIVGAPRSAIVTMVFWECLLLFLLANSAGLLLHWLLTPSFFSKFQVVPDLVYTGGDYLNMTVITFVIILISLLPMLRKYTRLSPVRARQERM